MMRPARLAVGVVSAGRVGSVLGAASPAPGTRRRRVRGLPRLDAARRALLPDVPLLPPDEVVRDADLVLLAVPDDVLAGLVRGLVVTDASAGADRRAHLGAHGIECSRRRRAGVLSLALHPVMTFTGRAEDLARLRGQRRRHRATDDRRPGPSARRWRRDGRRTGTGARIRPVAVPRRAGARRESSGHPGDGLRGLARQRRRDLRAERALGAAAAAALDNVLRHGDPALTGPVVRGDIATVPAHLRHADPARPRYPPGLRHDGQAHRRSGRGRQLVWHRGRRTRRAPRPSRRRAPRPVTHTEIQPRHAEHVHVARAREPGQPGAARRRPQARARADHGRAARRAPRADPPRQAAAEPSSSPRSSSTRCSSARARISRPTRGRWRTISPC